MVIICKCFQRALTSYKYMEVKTDTKEKFIVLTPVSAHWAANMTAEVRELAAYASPTLPHLVINLKELHSLEEAAATELARLQQAFYERDHSLVICEMTDAVEKVFEDLDLLDSMNVTPTESEAWDILQMEEIERELLREGGE